MPASKFIVIDGKPHLWRDLLEKRREQLAAVAKATEQPTLFVLKLDARPLTERKAADRYLQPSLFSLESLQQPD